MTIKDEKEPFVARWSRLKQEERKQQAEQASRPDPGTGPQGKADPNPAPPDLPPLDRVNFDTDFKQFFHPKVDEDVRRAALKKLFSDPRFNLMDGLDVYIEDYSKAEPIPAAMLAGLQSAQQIIKWAKEDPTRPQEADAPNSQVAAGEQPASQKPAPSPPPDSGSAESDRVRPERAQEQTAPEPTRRKV